MADTVISCAEAKAQGLKTYFTGRPCKHGHIARRNALNGTCAAERNRTWHADNPDKSREGGRRWAAANRDKVNAASREANKTPAVQARKARWYQENKQRVSDRRKERYRADPKRYVQETREWIERNRERARESFRLARSRRRARVRNSSGQHTAADLKEIFALQGGRCAYCRADLRRHRKQVDHIVPLASGGSDDRSNIQYLCAPCNQTKNAKDPLDFARERGLLL